MPPHACRICFRRWARQRTNRRRVIPFDKLRDRQMNHETHEVLTLLHIAPHTPRIELDDGIERTIDFGPVLHGSLLGPLRNPELFAQARIDPEVRTLSRPNGADFDPETLYHWVRYVDRLAEQMRGG